MSTTNLPLCPLAEDLGGLGAGAFPTSNCSCLQLFGDPASTGTLCEQVMVSQVHKVSQ